MTPIYGGRIEPLDPAASKAWLDWVIGTGPAPAMISDPAWVLCHGDDGVTWGRLERGTWRLGSTEFPDLCPAPSRADLQELRVFWPAAEILIWRTPDGLRGRILRDADEPDGLALVDAGPLRPDDEERVLVGDRVAEYRNGFTRVHDGAGVEQALPVHIRPDSHAAWPRLRVRHYFGCCSESGCARVIATRLVEVK